MFEPVSWENDQNIDSIAAGICQKYDIPKEKQKHGSNISTVKKGKEKAIKRKKIHNTDKSDSPFPKCKKKSIETPKDPTKLDDLQANTEVCFKTTYSKKLQKNNKYKHLSKKDKFVGKDAKEACPVIDIPRRIKFAGGSNLSNISEWQHEKEENPTNNERKVKKKKKKKALINKMPKTDTSTCDDAIKLQSNVVEEYPGHNDEPKKKKTTNKKVMNKGTECNEDVILTGRKKKKRHLETNDGENLQEGETVSIKKSKLKKRKLNSKKVDLNPEDNISAQKQTEKVLCKIDEEFHSELSPPSKKSPFNIAKLKSLLSENENKILNSPKKENKSNEIFKNKKNKTDNDNDPNSDKIKCNKKKKPESFKERLQSTLNAAQFRFLNEVLYTHTGKEAYTMFRKDRHSFECYHTGFQGQVEKWPENPVDVVITYIKQRSEKLIVADFGCGEAKIAQNVPNKVMSFDLVAINKHVTACDMANVPLLQSTVDIAVFCLSLMGTNLVQYLAEASRVLKKGGVLLIAEVTSRFEKVGKFVKKVEKLGFTLNNQNQSGKMFLWFEFKKTGKLPTEDRLPNMQLEPCLYKKR